MPKFGVPPLTRRDRACRNISGMGRRLVVELEPGSPPSGRVTAADGSSIRFSGWTELAQALEADAAGEPACRQDGEAPAGKTPPA